MNYKTCNETETVEVATQFAATLKPGAVVTLSGELGAGKSVFCRAVMRALGVLDEALPSPTFAIIQEYEAKHCRIAHMDWYRLEGADEVAMLGVSDFFQPPWICLIEWPERAAHLLPEGTLQVYLQCDADHIESRLIRISHS